MPVQDSYTENMRKGVPGQIADMTPSTLISRTVEEEGGIGFGVPVMQGTNDKGCLAYAGTVAPVGITVRDRSLDANNPDAFGELDSARVMTEGTVWVTASVAVAAGDVVMLTAAGLFTNTGGTVYPNARWDTSAGAGEIAIVRLS